MAEPFDNTRTEHSDTEYQGVAFGPGDLEEKDFELVAFKGCDFKAAAAMHCNFNRCRFEGCDLSNFKARGGRFNDCAFAGCKAIGVDWTQAGSFRHNTFDECNLSFCGFKFMDLRKARLRGCMIREADFARANLVEADFGGSVLSASQFSGADLSRADLRGARDFAIEPGTCKLKGARMSFPEALNLVRILGVEVEI